MAIHLTGFFMTMTQTFNRIHPLMAAAVCRRQRDKWRSAGALRRRGHHGNHVELVWRGFRHLRDLPVAGVDSHYPYRNLHLRFGASGDRQSFDYELASSLLSPNAEWVVHRP